MMFSTWQQSKNMVLDWVE